MKVHLAMLASLLLASCAERDVPPAGDGAIADAAVAVPDLVAPPDPCLQCNGPCDPECAGLDGVACLLRPNTGLDCGPCTMAQFEEKKTCLFGSGMVRCILSLHPPDGGPPYRWQDFDKFCP